MLSYHTKLEKAITVADTILEQQTAEKDTQLPRAYLAASAIVTLIAGYALLAGEAAASTLSPLTWALTMLSILPLVVAQLALGHPQTWLWLRARTRGILRVEQRWMLLPIGCYLLGGLAMGRFDPYATAVYVAGVFITIGTLAQADRGYPRMMWTDTTFWVFLWIPFDFRWNYDLWYGLDDLAYAWWAVMLTVVAVYGYGVLRDFPGLGYRLIPRWLDVEVALLATAGFAAIAIPVGLAIRFLTFPPTATPHLSLILLQFVGLFLTVAIPEELFFRGILQNGLNKHLRNPRLALMLASLAFGLMHWNNADAVIDRLAYAGLATVAGLFYGWAYERSDGLLAPILCHTLVDLIWRFGFQ
ncbi:MAG: CPBP family intramembrane metalloprotease [Chloroflexi bacterium]|nr:MAG: CPBP family intramembrane metalloprotease [Chloroflexota bacterium]